MKLFSSWNSKLLRKRILRQILEKGLISSWSYKVLIVCSGALIFSLAAHAQLPLPSISAIAPPLTVSGEVKHPFSLKLSDLAKLPQHSLKATDHDGIPATFSGVLLVDVLRLAGAPLGNALRGQNLALYLLAEAADDYQVVFALPELDPDFTDRVVLLASRRNGEALSTDQGPLRLVVPDEKRRARWIRRLTGIKILRASSGK